MSFEYELKLSDGRKVYAVGQAILMHRCDCCDGRPHIQYLEVESLIELHADGRESEMTPEADVLIEIEGMCDSKLYAEIANAEVA